MCKWTCLLVLFWLNCADSLKILGVFPFPATSHTAVFVPLMKGLSAKGHEITIISHLTSSNKTSDKIKYITLSEDLLVNAFNMADLPTDRWVGWIDVLDIADMGYTYCKLGLKDPEFGDFLQQEYTYDLIIGEFFATDCFLGLVHKYKAPLIGITSSSIYHWNNDLAGNRNNPSYLPINALTLSNPLTFLERVENTVIGFGQQVYYDHVVVPQQDAMARKYFGNDMPYLKDIMMNTSLFLTNAHFSLHLPKPAVPAVVDVGGIHIVSKSKTLPGVSIASTTCIIRYSSAKRPFGKYCEILLYAWMKFKIFI